MQRIVILLFCFLPFYCLCQIKARVYTDGNLSDTLAFSDTLAVKNFIESKKIAWLRDGYYFAGIDSSFIRNDSSFFYLHKGRKMGFEISGIKRKSILDGLSKNLASYTNSGYPFASVFLDSITVDGHELKGVMRVNKGPEIFYDSAFFIEKIKTSHNYIYHLLDIVPDDPFEEDVYQKIDSRITRSPFLSLNRPTDISFSQSKAKIYLDLQEQTTNSFQGVLGLQQNQRGGTSIVGSLDLTAQNLFRSGHEFQFNWESFAESSQQLNLFYQHAFLMNAKLSPSFRFGLLKQDTTFITRNTAIGLNMYLGSKTSLLIEYEGTNGALISTDQDELTNGGLADFKRNFYQLALNKGHFRSLASFNQTTMWKVSIGGGTKEIERNVGLPSSFYDTIFLKTNFLRFESRLAYQLKIGKRQTIFHDLQIGILDNKQLLTNELYRLGGLNTLRGFNEKNIFASQFALSRVEFRSFFENNSFIYGFYDQLIFKRSSNIDSPLGIGLGFALETSSGQFSFALASGSSKNQSFSFSEMRAHFGFITKF